MGGAADGTAEAAEAPEGLFCGAAPLTIPVRPGGGGEAQATLHYFAMKGRAEVARLVLAEAEVTPCQE